MAAFPSPAAVWNFPRTSEHHLALHIGETVHILQASEGKGLPNPAPALCTLSLADTIPFSPWQAGTAGTRSGTGLPG